MSVLSDLTLRRLGARGGSGASASASRSADRGTTSRMTRRSVATTGSMLAIALSVAACGGGGSTAADATNSAAAGGSGDSNGTLTLFIQSPPTTLNPYISSAQDGQLNVDVAYSSLLVLNANNQVVSGLAKGYRFVGNGHKEFQLTLRPNARFSDGSKLTAADVKASIYYGLKTGNIGASAFPLKKVTTPNATTVDLYFSQPDPFAAGELSQGGGGPFTAISLKAMHTKKLGYETFGAGPYELDRSATTPGSVYTYVPNPYYFDHAQQKWHKVVIKLVSNENSSIEAAGSTPDSFTIGEATENSAARSAGLQLTPSAYTMNYGMMLLDRQGKVTPALGSQKVRQALNYAVDRSVDAQALKGHPTEQLVAPGFMGHYTPNIYSYNVAKAKQLLASAGYPHGFTFSALVGSYDPTAAETAQLLVHDFSKIGVTLKLVSMPTQGAFGTAQASKKYPAAVENLPANDVSFLTLTVFPKSFFDVFNDPEPTPDYGAEFATAGTKSGPDETSAYASLGRQASQYAWAVWVAVFATPYYASKNLSVPKSWGPTPDPVYITRN